MYAMTGTLSAITAALPPASTPVDTVASCTDLSPTMHIPLINNGTDWVLRSGSSVIQKSSLARGVAPSGTISTGSSGNITLGTALTRVYDAGCYLYLPDIATTPAITAGLYWCVMSSTTVGTVYASKGGAAINFSVGSAFTGATTEVTLATISLPAYAFGLDGGLNVTYGSAYNNGAGGKTTRLRLDGSTAINVSGTTSLSQQNQFRIVNCGSYSKQKYFSGGGFAYANSAAAFGTATVDTTAAFSFTITGQHGTNATDTYMLEYYEVELCRW